MFDAIFPKHWTTLQRLMWLKTNALARAVYETITGNPVSFTALRSAPLKSLLVSMSPVQDLHGYSSPWPAGGGKNLINAGNLSVPASENTSVVIADTISLSAGTYTLSWTQSATVTATRNRPLFAVGGTNTYADADSLTAGRNSWTFTLAADSTVQFKWWYSAVSAACTISDFQLESGSSATTFAPYSNICPISGYEGVTANVAGKNLLNNEASVFSNVGLYKTCKLNLPTGTNLFMSLEDNDTSVDASSIYFGFVSDDYTSGVLPSGTYKWAKISGAIPASNIDNVTSGGTLCSVICYPATDEALNTFFARYKVTVTVGSTASAYTPYVSGTTVSVTFPAEVGTVYSGYVDVISGVGEIDRKSYRFDGTENWTYESAYSAFQIYGLITDARSMTSNIPNAICSSYIEARRMNASAANGTFVLNSDAHTANRLYIKNTAYDGTTKSEFAASLIGQTIVYELATPIPIQLTPQEVLALVGENNIWANTNGDVTVTYRSN